MNDAWMQIKADVLQMAIEVPVVQECTAFGAALLAGIGAGVYRDVQDALQKTYRVGRIVKPNRETKALYDSRYAVFTQLYETLHAVNCALEY